jgi:non-ribosomal peptide synthetase component E (peptide arylation enzyme)
MSDHGYFLFEDSREFCENNDIPFSRFDVLRIAQEYGLAEGYGYAKERVDGRQKYFLVKSGERITSQDVANRLMLLNCLFNQEEVGGRISRLRG